MQMQMQDPGQGVAPQLQSHVHLISLHRYPYCPSLNIEQAYQYLQDAPTVVKRLAPMAWNYVSAPQDGTCWLEWISEKTDQPYPSDGYAWADVEQTYTQEYNGYTIELKVQTTGYRPSHDQQSSHARTRYRFVAKNPSISAAYPDPSLWIVNYHRADQSRVFPVSSIPVSSATQNIMAQRRWLENHGQLERKEFMLHDREHWPVLNVPAAAHMQQPGAYALNNMARAQNRFPQPQMQQQGNVHPHKRVRTQPPHQMPGAGDIPLEATIEDEEDTSRGDFFDHLTPRDISLARYTQHQRWMEEVYSSPFATNQIVPTSLGLGLMGELKGLTDGILEPPVAEGLERPDNKLSKTNEPQPFANISKEQLEEFNKRVEKHLEEGQAEIERMKAEHTAKMQDWQKVKTLTQAEKRLRGASWKGNDEVASTFRLDQPTANGHDEERYKYESVEGIVKEVEDMLKVKIEGHENCKLIAKGGLTEINKQSGPQATDLHYRNGASPSRSFNTSGQESEADRAGQADKSRLAGQSLNGNGQGMGQSSASMGQDQYTSTANQSGQYASHDQNAMSANIDNLPDLDMDDALMDSMDIDMDESGLNFDDLPNADSDDESRNPTPVQSTGNGQGANSSPLAGTTSVIASNQQAHSSNKEGNSANDASDGIEMDDDALDTTGDANMFNDTFADLDNLDGGDDDGLIDFEGGGMGMEDSAFGDALHGMETHDGPAGEGGTPTVEGS